jgi:hypothetical protein
MEDIIQAGVVNGPQSAAVAILYSEASDIWLRAAGPNAGTAGHKFSDALMGDQNTANADFRTSYITLKHAGLAVDVLIEGDAARGRLNHYSVLYIISTPQIEAGCAVAIAAWVRSGGILFSAGGGGLLDERNRTNSAMQGLLGVNQSAVYRGNRSFFNSSVSEELL